VFFFLREKIIKVEEFTMLWVGLFIGLVLGANISLFLYAIILSGKKEDEIFYSNEREVIKK